MPDSESPVTNLSPLHAKLLWDARQWREKGYQSEEHPLIGAILRWQWNGEPGTGTLKYLRLPQFLALEVYWYLRLKRQTPLAMELYRQYYKELSDFTDVLGIPISRDALNYIKWEELLKEIKTPEFAKERKITELHEAATLPYPSYIFSLAMGAGKTVLIGTIVATEFAMALDCDKSHPGVFMKNALIFAPGTTIIESLREISDLPLHHILPPGMDRDVGANMLIEYPHTGDKGLQCQPGSSFNVIITNTEKIRLQVRPKKNQIGIELEREELLANHRLLRIASLPALGVFSDEAHHTYGNPVDKIKRVRETINYIHEQSPLLAVVNTTGTPYSKKKILKEVVFWYGLDQGMEDNILKSLIDGIHEYSMDEQDRHQVTEKIIKDFFSEYGETTLPDGSIAKMAFYFKTQQHLDDLKPYISRVLSMIGIGPDQILINTQQSKKEEVDEFKRLNDPNSRIRVILLVQKGVEGWNCPSLFSCALIREQSSSTFVLQAATRCLRQIPGNSKPARIYLDQTNAVALEKELQSNFGLNLSQVQDYESRYKTVSLKIRKTDLPKLKISKEKERVVPISASNQQVKFSKVINKAIDDAEPLLHTVKELYPQSFDGEILFQTEKTERVSRTDMSVSCYTAAWRLASNFHLPYLDTVGQLRELYKDGDLPLSHLAALYQQAETQLRNYKKVSEIITDELALIREYDHDGNKLFTQEGDDLVHRIQLLDSEYDRSKSLLLDIFQSGDAKIQDRHDISYHYTPYNFDSQPEMDFFRQILRHLNKDPKDVKAFIFSGGLTDPRYTDYYIDYLGKDDKYHKYFPDFVIVKSSREFLIVEIKGEHLKADADVVKKSKAVKLLERLSGNKFKYMMFHVKSSQVGQDKIEKVKKWLD